ncbi:sodium/sugar symporter [Pontibacter sp. G13]|uniref:sodium/sugar symporter n=1 Tax=Pontibacter sp. G13 TaxID=3074898 RepID=UPI00288B732F|nr:sodium/sugar symporter [Pontibacter sp. G13]WNJ17072.1 sodium/sugar symporter [Pontibacter sp. G13]
MDHGFEMVDYIIFALYVVAIVIVGLLVSRNKKGQEKTQDDYFLAGRNLTWWAIGASLIAANISAEHFIGMSGSGYALGLGIAAYEWMAAITLIVVGKFFLPIFLKKGIYTMPQFLEGRFNKSVSSAFAVFWLIVYVFVNLTSVIYLGALAMESVLGISMFWGILGLAIVAGIYSIYGGLTAVAWTDVIQVIFLVGGGLVTTYMALEAVSPGSVMAGFDFVVKEAGDHFVMVMEKGEFFIPDGDGGMKDAYIDLPGLAVIIGAMWLTNMGYWGFNQYIIQKGLAARSMKDAQNGLVFAGFLKILIPLIVVIPGITAYVLLQHPEMLSESLGITLEAAKEMKLAKSDEAYPWLLTNFVPTGIKGLAFAALVAAIISSLASMVNSTSTIFSIDIYKSFINPKANDRQMVLVGRLVAVAALLIATATAYPLLGSLDQAFQYIQEYTGFVYPGVIAVFMTGLFWKQATSKAALVTAIITIPLGIFFKFALPETTPFLLRMGYVFVILVLATGVISLFDKSRKVEDAPMEAGKAKGIMTTSYVLGGLSILCLVLGIAFSGTYANIAFESVFITATLLGMLSVILYTNVKMGTKDANALEFDVENFKTDAIYNVGALIITVIVGGLYYIFW